MEIIQFKWTDVYKVPNGYWMEFISRSRSCCQICQNAYEELD